MAFVTGFELENQTLELSSIGEIIHRFQGFCKRKALLFHEVKKHRKMTLKCRFGHFANGLAMFYFSEFPQTSIFEDFSCHLSLEIRRRQLNHCATPKGIYKFWTLFL